MSYTALVIIDITVMINAGIMVGYESPCRAQAAEPELPSQKIQI